MEGGSAAPDAAEGTRGAGDWLRPLAHEGSRAGNKQDKMKP